METPKSSSTSTPINNISKSNLLNPTSDSPAFQDSPVFNYLSNLSPIQPVKAGSVAQGFPGLASPPLVFTSPLINSQKRFFSRKLQSSGSNSEFSQDHEKPKINEKDLNYSLKLDPEFPSPPIDHQKTCDNTEKLLRMALCTPSSGFDDVLPDPEQHAKSSHETQSCGILAPVEGGCLEKKDDGYGKDGVPVGSVVQKGKEAAQLKSRISFKLVKNEPRRLISSPECSGALPRLLTERNSENFQTGESFCEASHLERGTLRRCLFDESQKKNTAAGSGVWNPIASGQISKSAIISTEKSVSRKMINLCKPVTSTCVSPVPANNPVSNSKPLGIGLHLNSVVYPRSTDNTVGSQQSSLVKIEGKSSLFVIKNQSNEKVGASNVTGNVVASSEEIDQHQACVVPTSDKAIASDALELFNDAIEASLDACSTSTHGNDKLNSDLSESKESGLIILSPKKKRKRASSDDETNKRCNCRKTKCLKLYCDCFAAGFYCGESCACQGCFNRPENKGTVLETRQQIESRNPLAFAPKIVQPVSGVPVTIEQEMGTLSTPSSARHKRGCNCKKSMCLKKYCECYQANVGCSDGCRCEGCKNIYGTREDHSIAREVMIKRASLEMSEGTMMDNSNLVSSREHSSLKLTPVTPALQCSDQRKNALQSRLPFKRFLRTPDSQHDMLTSGVSLSQNHGVHPEKIESKDVGALETEKGSENTEDRLVPASDESKYAPCSFQSSNTLAKDSDSKKIPQPHSFAESVPTPSSNSLRWRSSPITPITEVATSELKDFEAGVKRSDLFEDETPDILKQSYSPNKSVKVSSPNKKRISPPHKHMISSESLTCSRKFVLRAVPSFPSLTPCFKSSSNDNRGQSSK